MKRALWPGSVVLHQAVLLSMHQRFELPTLLAMLDTDGPMARLGNSSAVAPEST